MGAGQETGTGDKSIQYPRMDFQPSFFGDDLHIQEDVV